VTPSSYVKKVGQRTAIYLVDEAIHNRGIADVTLHDIRAAWLNGPEGPEAYSGLCPSLWTWGMSELADMGMSELVDIRSLSSTLSYLLRY
jgi:hypothetical protein